jgi:hypothetical protein
LCNTRLKGPTGYRLADHPEHDKVAEDTMVVNMKGKENFCKDYGYFIYSENTYPCNGQVCEEQRETVAQISLITPAVAQLPA